MFIFTDSHKMSHSPGFKQPLNSLSRETWGSANVLVVRRRHSGIKLLWPLSPHKSTTENTSGHQPISLSPKLSVQSLRNLALFEGFCKLKYLFNFSVLISSVNVAPQKMNMTR